MAKQYSVSVLVELLDKFTQPFGKMNKNFQDIAQRYEKIGSTMNRYVTLPILGIGIAAAKSAADIEKYDQSFTTMLKSADLAKKFTKDLRDFSAKTPLQFGDLARNAELMMAFNIQSKDILPTLQMLGDVARGDAQKLNQLSLAYSQMYATGRLMGQDLLQMINAGFNPLTVIAEKTGKSMAELKDEMSKGQISVEMVTDAFKTATSAGGMFYKAMESQSKTFYGRLSTLADNFTIFLSKLGEVMFPLLNKMLDGLVNVVEYLNNLGDTTKGLIVAFLGLAAAAGPVFTIVGKLMALFSTGISPVHLAIAGFAVLATTIMAVSEAVDKHNKRFTITAEKAKKEHDEIQSLVSEYEALKKKTDLNVQEKMRLIDVEQQLKILLPQTAIEFDNQAKMIGLNTGALKKHLDELKKLEVKSLRQEVERLQGEYDTMEKAIAGYDKRIQDMQKFYEWGHGPITYGMITDTTKAQFRRRMDRDRESYERLVGEERKKLLQLWQKLQEAKSKLDEAEGKVIDKTNKKIKEQNDLLSKNLTFRQRIALLQQAFNKTGGFAVKRTDNPLNLTTIAERVPKTSRAEVLIKVQADNGATATIERVKKDDGDVGLNIISDSYLGYTVPAGG